MTEIQEQNAVRKEWRTKSGRYTGTTWGRRMLAVFLLCAAVALKLTAQEGQGTAAFMPSASAEREAGGAVVTVAFAIAEGGYVHEEGFEVSVAGVEVSFLYGDQPVVQDGERVFNRSFRRVYRAKGILGDGVDVAVSYAGCLSSGVCLMPETRHFKLALPPLPVGDGAAQNHAAEDASNVPTAGEGAMPGKASLGDASPGDASPDLPQAVSESGATEVSRCVGYQDGAAFLAWLERAESGVSAGGDDNALLRAVRRHGIWWAALLVVFWGVLLNLTPCVLPMIPVTLAILGAGARAGSRRRGLLLGGAYGVGMALAYGLLGVGVVFTGGQFGALNSQGWFNGAVAAVFVVLGLAMFDVISIDLSRFRVGRLAVNGGGRLAGAFCMGALSAVLSGACVAPVLIWVLVLSADLYSGGFKAGLALPFLLGVGMGLPWPVLGAGVSMLPRCGQWTVRLRQGFGVAIILLGVYYGVVCIRQLMPAREGAAQDGIWMTDWSAARRRAAQEHKPILADVWGMACKNCVLMDARVLSREDVAARLASFVCVKIQGDAEQNRPLMDAWKVQGFPTYLVLHVEPTVKKTTP